MQHLGPFLLEAELARGGMGVVYLATHVQTGVRYALKTLEPSALGDPMQLERFQREARALGQLRHPNVVRVHSADLAGPRPYLVQDLLKGGTLGERLSRGPLPVDEALRIALALADGVAAAHGAGILHRDLKPGNVLFDDRDQPLVVDFGLARARADDRLTQTGAVLGSPAYMAPEQAMAERREDERTDVYGLAGVTYAMLTGSEPIPARASLLSQLAAVANDPVHPIRSVRPEVPEAVATVVEGALAKDPQARPASARAFAEELRAAHAGRQGSSRGPLLALGAAVLVAAAFGVVGATRPSESGPVPSPEPQPEADDPEPLADPGEERRRLTNEAREALLAGDPRLALQRLDALPSPDARSDELRAAALLLQGDVDAARELRPGADWRRVCSVERRRLDLAERLQTQRGELQWYEDRGPAIAAAHQLLDDARTIDDQDLVGAALAARLKSTIAGLILELRQHFSRMPIEPLLELLDAAELLAGTEESDLPLIATRACLVQALHKVEKQSEQLRRLKRAEQLARRVLAHPRVAPRWRTVAWAVSVRAQRNEPLDRPGDLQLFDDVQRLTLHERDQLQAACWRESRSWLIQTSIGLRDPEVLAPDHAERWRNALAFAERRHRFVEENEDHESSRLGLATLWLYAKNTSRARAYVDEGPLRDEKHSRQGQFLTMEIDLLEGRNLEDHERMLGALHESMADPRLLTLRAAFRFALGREHEAERDLKAAGRVDVLKPYWFARDLFLPWRTAEETRLEHQEQGMRRLLAESLQ